jgi:hypothetical protein
MFCHKDHKGHKESGGFPQTPKTFVNFASFVDDATGCWIEDTPPDECENFLQEGGAL